MREHWREKDWVWRASEGSLRQAVVAAVDRIEALEAALVEAAHYLDRTSASDAAKKIRALISQPGDSK